MIDPATKAMNRRGPAPPDEFIAELRAQGTRYHNLHPVHRRMDAGELTREELAVLDQVDGRQTVRDVVRKLRMGSFDVSKLFFRLRRIRALRPRLSPTTT